MPLINAQTWAVLASSLPYTICMHHGPASGSPAVAVLLACPNTIISSFFSWPNQCAQVVQLLAYHDGTSRTPTDRTTCAVASLCLEALRPAHIAALSAILAGRLVTQLRAGGGREGVTSAVMAARQGQVVDNALCCINSALTFAWCVTRNQPGLAGWSAGEACDRLREVVRGGAALPSVPWRLAVREASDLGLLLHAVGARSTLLSALRAMCTAVDGCPPPEEDCLDGRGVMLSCALQAAELLPVRLAQWVELLSGGQRLDGDAVESWLVQQLQVALDAAGVQDMGSVARVEMLLQHPGLATVRRLEREYNKVVRQLSPVAQGGLYAVQEVVASGTFTALWGWGDAVCGRLLTELRAVCGVGEGSGDEGGGRGVAAGGRSLMGLADVAHALDAVRVASGVRAMVE